MLSVVEKKSGTCSVIVLPILTMLTPGLQQAIGESMLNYGVRWKGTVLDSGAGTGAHSRSLLLRGADRVICLRFLGSSFTSFRSKKKNDNLYAVCADAESLPLFLSFATLFFRIVRGNGARAEGRF